MKPLCLVLLALFAVPSCAQSPADSADPQPADAPADAPSPADAPADQSTFNTTQNQTINATSSAPPIQDESFSLLPNASRAICSSASVNNVIYRITSTPAISAVLLTSAANSTLLTRNDMAGVDIRSAPLVVPLLSLYGNDTANATVQVSGSLRSPMPLCLVFRNDPGPGLESEVNVSIHWIAPEELMPANNSIANGMAATSAQEATRNGVNILLVSALLFTVFY